MTALLVLATASWHSRTQPGFGQDSIPGYLAARNLVHGGNPYAPTAGLPFVYPPSSALLLSPLTLLDGHGGALAMLVLCGVAAAVLASASAAVAGTSWTGAWAAASMLALAGTNIGYGTVQRGNLSVVVAALLAVSLWLALRDRSIAAGVVLGVGIALKPLIAPAGLLLLLRRRERARGLSGAILVPVALNAALLPVLVQPFAYVTQILPVVSRGSLLPDRFNLSIFAWGDRWDLPSVIALASRVLVLACVLALLAAAASCEDPVVSVVTLAVVPVLAIALLSRVDEPHYSLVALPLLFVLLRRRQPLSVAVALLAALLIAVPVNADVQMLGQLLLVAAAALAVALHGRALDAAASRRAVTWWERQRPLAGLFAGDGAAGGRGKRQRRPTSGK